MNKRNYSVDLLRIIAMYMIIVIHILNKGGVIQNTRIFSLNYELLWFLEFLCIGAVNMYALITGYVMFNKSIKVTKIIDLWLKVIFYSFLFLGLYLILENNCDFKLVLKGLFPLSTNAYWYFTSYFGLFFLIPLLNILIEKCNKEKMLYFIIIGMVIFSLYPVVWVKDIFYFGRGYSLIWLAFLYIIGGYVRKYSFDILGSAKQKIILYFFSVLLLWICMFIIDKIGMKISILITLKNCLINYNMIFVLLSSLSFFLFFINKEIKNKVVIKCINIFSPVSFAVYLIHTNPIVYEFILNNLFSHYAQFNPIILILSILVTASIIYLICTIIEILRSIFFKLLNINQLVFKMSEILISKVQIIFEKIIKIIF